jgi:hypothetical protein
VRDGSDRSLRLVTARDPEAEDGRGVWLVERLGRAWGSTTTPMAVGRLVRVRLDTETVTDELQGRRGGPQGAHEVDGDPDHLPPSGPALGQEHQWEQGRCFSGGPAPYLVVQVAEAVLETDGSGGRVF